MSTRLIYSLATTDALAASFSDQTLLQAMCDFESALARAEAHVGIVPAWAAEVITRAATAEGLDIGAIVVSTRANGTASIALVKALEARVEAVDADAARYVHLGATSQDVFDTALILCVRTAWSTIDADHQRLCLTLGALSDAHAASVVLGRTLMQPAPPVTFGLKVAGWLGAVSRTWRTWATAYDHLLVLQFGGASGTLASLGASAGAVETALARELDLAVPDAPWHSHRDRLVAFVAAAANYTAALGKIARDISLLMQSEVAEAAEPGGGSSAMPHKRNPSGCASVLAAATRMPGLVASMLTSAIHEHERSVGGWHAEAPVVADAVQTAGAALSTMATLAGHLTVDVERMRDNIRDARGVIFAERLASLLVPAVGRRRSAELAAQAVADAQRLNITLAEAAAAIPAVTSRVLPGDVSGLVVPETYLGSAEPFRQRLISAAADRAASRKH